MLSFHASHNRVLIYLMTQAEDIMDIELCLADVQPAVRTTFILLSPSFTLNVTIYPHSIASGSLNSQTIGGAMQEFIFAPRVDNLVNCSAGLQVLFP